MAENNPLDNGCEEICNKSARNKNYCQLIFFFRDFGEKKNDAERICMNI
jgi:hypothetical protein